METWLERQKEYMYVRSVCVVREIPHILNVLKLKEREKDGGREAEEEDEELKIAAATRSTAGPLGSIGSRV